MSDSVLESLQQVSQLLQNATNVTNLAQQLGAIIQQVESEISVRPNDKVFTQLSVVSQPNSAEPAHIRLALAAPVALSILSAQFGTPQKLPPTPRGKVRQIFNAAYQGTHYNVTLIVEGGDSIVDLVLRRDIRLA